MRCLASIERLPVRAWPAVWLTVCSLLLVTPEPSTSAANDSEAGFDIHNARTRLVDGVYLLDADISFVFSDEALEAIENGVPVTIILEMQVLRQRGFIWDKLWWDKVVAQVEGELRIETRPLSSTYLVRNVNSGETQVYRSFSELTAGLGEIRDFPLLDAHLLGDKGRHHLRLRALLDIESLPSPMRPLAYLNSLWRLRSDWYEWPIEP